MEPSLVPPPAPALVALVEREILQHAVEEVARLLHADGGLIYLVEGSAEGSDAAAEPGLRFAHGAGIADDVRLERLAALRLPIGEGLFGSAVGRREPQVTADYLADAAFHTRRRPTTSPETSASCRWSSRR
jgi:hypothetical protein